MINFDGVDFSGHRSEEVMFLLTLSVSINYDKGLSWSGRLGYVQSWSEWSSIINGMLGTQCWYMYTFKKQHHKKYRLLALFELLKIPVTAQIFRDWTGECMGNIVKKLILTCSIRDSETSIDFVQGPPGSRRERVNWCGNQ